MSKKTMYRRKNAEGMAPSERASIVPNAAPAVAKTSMSAGAKFLVALLVIVAVLAVAVLVLNILVNGLANKLGNVDYNEQDLVITPVAGSACDTLPQSDKYSTYYDRVLTNYAEASHDIKSADHIYNFAIYGISEANGKKSATYLMVASFNAETKKVTYVEFYGHMVVYIPSITDKAAKSVGPLKEAYDFGGALLLTKTIKHNFGIDINGYIEMNMSVVEKLIDSVGGIEIGGSKKTGAEAVDYVGDNLSLTGELVKTLATAIFKSGIGGMLDCLETVSAESNIAIVKEDFVAVGKLAVSALKNASPTTVKVGDDCENVWYPGISAHACNDYEAERVALQNALYN